jgi:hypothetical protein
MPALRGILLLFSLLGALSANAATSVSINDTSDCVFNWVEKTYASVFSPTVSSQTLGVYYFRFYAGSNSYLAVTSDSLHLLYVGALSGGGLVDLGTLADWQSKAACPASTTTPATPGGTTGSTTSTTTTGSTTGSTTGNTAAADLAEIKTQLAAFQNLFATALPSAAAVQAFFDPSFINNGGDGPTSAANWVKALPGSQANLPFVPGMQLAVDLLPANAIDAGQSSIPGSVEWIIATASFNGYSGDRDSLRFKMIKNASSGQWLIAGNQRLIKAKVYPAAVQLAAPLTMVSGLHFRVSSKFTAANGASPQVVVAGPGLPAAGVTLSKKTLDGWLIQDIASASFVVPADAPSCTSSVAPNYPACANLADPALVDGAIYTFKLNDAAGSVYYDRLKKAPLPDSSIAANMFPSFSISPSSLSSLTLGSTSTVSFSTPAGVMPWYAEEYLSTQNVVPKPLVPTVTPIASGYALQPSASTASFSVGSSSGTSGTMALPSGNVVTGGLVEIMSMDGNGRLFSTFQLY